MEKEIPKQKKRRRGRNEGSIRWVEEKKLWQARYPIGIDEEGKTKYKSIYGKKKTGPGGLLEKMRDALQALGKGTYVDPSETSLIAWCKEWYEVYKEPTLKRVNTKEKYLQSLKRLEKDEIANMRLKDLSLELIQKYYNKLKRQGSSESTIRITHALINGALDKAEEINKITKNPAGRVVIPKDEDEGEVKALNAKQQDMFLEDMGRSSHYYMYSLFGLNTGLRPGETVALDRIDLDFKKNRVKISKTFVPKLKGNQDGTKTRSSKRYAPVPADVMRLMKEYMLRQPNQKDDAPLFQSLTGTRLCPRNILRQFKRVGERIGCPWVNPHTMRHTFASNLFAKKVDIKTISKLLGHKKVSTTYDIYVHFIDNTVGDSVQVLNEGIPETLPEKSQKKKDNVADLNQKVAIK